MLYEHISEERVLMMSAHLHRAVKMQHESEGEEQRKKEEAAVERKRKAEEKDNWEANRDTRVAGE